MKVNRSKIEWYIKNIRRDCEINDIELTDEVLADKLANYIEVNPGCIDMYGVAREERYSYSTVGYGIYSLLGERYRMGRIEIFDNKNKSGYAVSEGSYCMPFEAARQFEDFIESLETNLPIEIKIGSHSWCQEAVSEELGIPVELLNDPETKKEFYKKKNDDYAREKGFKDFDALVADTFLGKKQNEE